MDYRDVMGKRAADLTAESDAILAKAIEENRALTEEEIERREQVDKELALIEKSLDVYRRKEKDEASKIIETGIKAQEDNVSAADLVRAMLQPFEKRQGVHALVQSTPAYGGYLVPDRVVTEIISVAREASVVRPRATVYPPNATTPDAPLRLPLLDLTVGKYGGASVGWNNEAAAKHETDLTLAQIVLEPHELSGVFYVSDQLLANAPALQMEIERLFRTLVSEAEDNAFLFGTGEGQPTGMVGHDATIAVDREGATISYGDLLNMYARQFSNNAVWLVNRSVFVEILALTDSVGRPLLSPNVPEGVPLSLLGSPVVITEAVPADPDEEGAVMYCDFAYYAIADFTGPIIAASEHYRFRENITTIKGFFRVDGKPRINAPIEANGITKSPFVILGGAR